MSAAFPDITPQHASVSPLLAEAVNDNLLYLTKISKTVLEMIQEVATIHDKAAASIYTLMESYKKKLNDCSKPKPYCQSESFIKFINRLFEQLENQAKVLQTVSSSFSECVVVPVREVMEKKKEVWKTCFFYIGSFQQQIKQKEDDLVKRYKDYSDAANKIKTSADGKGTEKQQLMYHNSHNTYLLRLSSVNSINRLLYTHVLPYVLHSIEKNQSEMNDCLRHHIKYMFTVQKETLKKISKSVDKIDHATDRIDLVSDLNKFVKAIKGQVKDKSPPQHAFSTPSFGQSRRFSTVLFESLENKFVVNHLTQPNLQRRLAALQSQTSELVDEIASMRAGEKKDDQQTLPKKQIDDPSLEELSELLSICDKEANLNVLLKQMELYTNEVTEFLGPISADLLRERKQSRRSPAQRSIVSISQPGQKPHEFTEMRQMKPVQCFYCHKLVTFKKGCVCKQCKMSVHKKCATNVPFCEGKDIRERSNSTSSADTRSISTAEPSTPLFKPKAESAEVYDLIDLESEDDYVYDDDEFDDFSDDDEQTCGNANPEPLQKPVLKPTVLSPKPSTKPAFSMTKPLPKEPIEKLDYTVKVEKTPPPLPYRPPVRNNVSPSTPPKPKEALRPSLSAKPVLTKKPVLSTKPSVPLKPKSSKCVALYDFRSSQDKELSFTSGSVIEVLEKVDADWWKGRFNNFEGYFPCSYVIDIKADDQILRAIYPFDGQSEAELTVIEGQILLLVEQQEDWMKVSTGMSEGLVPSTYIEYI